MKLLLFGGFRLFDAAGSAVTVSARKATALLAWLALHQGSGQSRDRLAAMLWEESNDSQARHSLRQALSGLRRALGGQAEALVSDQQQIRLNAGWLRVDALEFGRLLDSDPGIEQLQQAVSLYGGELLEGFNPRSDSFEGWLTGQRSHYREQAAAAMSELLQHYLQSRQAEAGVRLAIQLLSADPLREAVHRCLMQLYLQLNRPADALRQYRQCRRVLRQELGLAPEPETDRLYRDILGSRSRGGMATPTDEPPTAADTRPAAAAGPGVGTSPDRPVHQLRPATVACCRMRGYQRLARSRDPEQLHLLNRELTTWIDQMTDQYGGRLLHRHNDSFSILFGVPKATGNETQKALQLALSMREQLVRGPGAGALGLNAGIASGRVVCSDNDLSGPVVAEAEQLQRSGEAGEILISDPAYRGLRLPVQADRREDGCWRVERLAGAAEQTFSAGFIGRGRELRQLTTALSAVLEDQAGETFLIRGEAGIGKTRLVQELADRAARMDVHCHRALTLDFGMESRTAPVPTLLRSLLSVTDDVTADELRARMRTCLGDDWNESLHLQVLPSLFRLPGKPQQAAQRDDLDEQARLTASRQILHGILRHQSLTRPLLLVVEDIHWSDRQTLMLIAELASAVSRCAALLVVTSRVEGEPLDPGWRSAMQGAPLTTLDLAPLPTQQALALARQLSPGNREFADRCVERAGGNPFFLEQLLYCQRADQGAAVPDTVQSLILARLDRLGDKDRAAAGAASVLGQRFSIEPLRWLLGDDDYPPEGLLGQRLIRPEGVNYLFSHALQRDAIYQSLPKAARRDLHRRAADWFRDRDSALHARHLDLADDSQAARAYLDAAQTALAAFDFEQALALAGRGGAIGPDAALKTRLDILCGELLLHTGRVSAATAAYRAAADLAADAEQRCRALIGLAAGLTVQDRLDEALATLDRAAPLADGCGHLELLTEVHYRRGDILFALARTRECLDAHRSAERHARRAGAPLLEIRTLAGLADAYYGLGRMNTAWRYFDRCIELAENENRLPQELGNLTMRGLTRFYNGAVGEAIGDERKAADLAAGYGNLRAEMAAHMNLSLILLYTDQTDRAEQAARRGLELAQQLGAGRFLGDNLAAIGEALALRGETEAGIEYLERAYRSALDSVPTHTAPFILGVLARVTPDRERQRRAITDGQRLLDRGSLSHNYLHFYQNLIDVCLRNRDAPGALRYADALEHYTRHEPLAWSNFYIARGRLLADHLMRGRHDATGSRAETLLDAARAAGLHYGTGELRALIA